MTPWGLVTEHHPFAFISQPLGVPGVHLGTWMEALTPWQRGRLQVDHRNLREIAGVPYDQGL